MAPPQPPQALPSASASSTINLHNRPGSGDDFADFFHSDQFDFGHLYGTSGTREFDFDWDSFMVAADGGINRDISDGTGIHTGACFEHSSSEPTRATSNGISDVMAGSTTSLHPLLTQDATANHATSELLGDVPTAPSLGDNSPKKSTSPDSSATTSTSERNRKRQRNTETARRYRQRKVDRTAELEEALAAVSKERDELRLRLARSEAEAEVLRRMVRN
ncbi:hypothetical protein D0869_05310 [Hortaea werneckii]|uniref:BZIP domain-containing protein n=1 Tax=Hortaea werneckii TaxID=91943 RepID=A0A3M6WXR6_HORWE|nr:hypothetical protein D0869_05310 [Hortaea werneckii]RMY16520.1 hypothetical protein D0867_06491 [Hortaea werneckii]